MTRRIIVEGPDGSGKTRMVERLADSLGVPVAPKASNSTQGPVPDLVSWVNRDLQSHPPVTQIYDRHPLISELIYGPVIRGKTQFGQQNLHWLGTQLEMFYAYNPMIIYCLPPFIEVAHNVDHNSGNQMPGVIYNIKTLYELYLAQWARDYWRTGVWKWNYQEPHNLDHIINQARRFRDGE